MRNKTPRITNVLRQDIPWSHVISVFSGTYFKPLLSLVLSVFLIACSEDPEDSQLPETIVPTVPEVVLAETLEAAYSPLSDNPLNWTDSDLAFLDPIADKQIIAMGEATHGTAEFFDAKFRVFRYLVENHGFRVFAIEADFGESLILNDAIQRGATDEIEGLMKSRMIFWTWRTEEVKNLLEWMSDFNRGKAEEEKLQYFGVDAQFNIYNTDLLRDYLRDADASFATFANTVLNEAKAASQSGFEGFDQASFEAYLERMDALGDSIAANEAVLVSASSEAMFRLNRRLHRVIRQVSEVLFAQSNEDFSVNFRDQYMAENTAWLTEYFDNAKVFVWAHNAHVAKDPVFGGAGGAMGRQLQRQFGTNYYSLGFLFSQGTFTARGASGSISGNPGEQRIQRGPIRGSMNDIMRRATENAFAVEIDKLNAYDDWQRAFSNDLQFFQIGALYNDNPEDYYLTFNPIFFDQIIYIDQSTASKLLPLN